MSFKLRISTVLYILLTDFAISLYRVHLLYILIFFIWLQEEKTAASDTKYYFYKAKMWGGNVLFI